MRKKIIIPQRYILKVEKLKLKLALQEVKNFMISERISLRKTREERLRENSRLRIFIDTYERVI